MILYFSIFLGLALKPETECQKFSSRLNVEIGENLILVSGLKKSFS